MVINSALGASLGGSASGNSGVIYPKSKIGLTFLVLVEDPEGVFIDLSEKKPVSVEKNRKLSS